MVNKILQMSLMSGTICTVTEKNVLSARDLPAILKAAQRSGVIELKFGSLYVRFGVAPPPGEADAHKFGPKPTPAAEIAELQARIEETSLLEAEVSQKEAELAQMFIEDPEQAERMLSEGDLIDDEERDNEET